jgi:flagellar hook assembly protein FlgD
MGLNQEEFEYVEQAVSSMPLAPDQKRLLRLSFYKSQGREVLPRAYSLAQNRPNPFNPSTAISYTVPENSAAGPVSIRVFDIRGTLVKVLVEGVKGSGEYTVFWDGTDNRGRSLPSGIYFCRMQAKGFAATRKMLLLK